MGLIFGQLQAVNSLESVLMSMDRALQYTELMKAKARLPAEQVR